MDWHLSLLKNQRHLNKLVLAGLLSFSAGAFAQSDKVTFEKKQIKLGSRSVLVEIAQTEQQLSRGLMFRKSLAQDEGMLFIFPQTRTLSFWMKNTFIPLSIGFFGEDKKLIEVVDMKPATSIMQTDHPSYMSSKPARYALEMNQGWFKKHGIKPGVTLVLPK